MRLHFRMLRVPIFNEFRLVFGTFFCPFFLIEIQEVRNCYVKLTQMIGFDMFATPESSGTLSELFYRKRFSIKTLEK